MPEEKRVMETYAILLGGGLVLAGLLIFVSPPAPRSFYLDSVPCDARRVMDWLRRKLNQGKITADDIQRLLNTPISFGAWLQTVLFKHSPPLDGQDLTELIAERICGGSPAVGFASPYSCPPCCP